MKSQSFDELARRLAPVGASRRSVVRTLGSAAGAVLAGCSLDGVSVVRAAPCRNDGKTCTKRRQCCSGVCTKGMCQHGLHQGTCTIDKKSTSHSQTFCQASGAAFCFCYVTTHGASVCTANTGSACAHCRRNKDCDKVTGPGSFCVG